MFCENKTSFEIFEILEIFEIFIFGQIKVQNENSINCVSRAFVYILFSSGKKERRK